LDVVQVRGHAVALYLFSLIIHFGIDQLCTSQMAY